MTIRMLSSFSVYFDQINSTLLMGTESGRKCYNYRMRTRTIIFLIALIALMVAFSVFFFLRQSNAPIKVDNGVSEQLEQKEEPSTQSGLPPKVEAKRQAILKAARTRDYEKLASEASPNLEYSFGGGIEGGFAEYLRLSEESEGESAFDIIPTILALPYGERDDLYSWPSFYTIEPSKWTEEDIRMMRTFLTEKQIEDFRQFGGYIYYRMGITSEGEWIFYLAGD